MKLEPAFGEVLKAYRLQAGLSQVALAERAGMHNTTISYYEVGRRKPTIYTLFILARALELQPATMIKKLQELKPEID
jgi:transcriptional regulator with XRE-family HTH domain